MKLFIIIVTFAVVRIAADAAIAGKIRSERFDPMVSVDEALTVAQREVEARERWGSAARFLKPQRSSDGWSILAHRSKDTTTEIRVVVISSNGKVKDYVDVTALNAKAK